MVEVLEREALVQRDDNFVLDCIIQAILLANTKVQQAQQQSTASPARNTQAQSDPPPAYHDIFPVGTNARGGGTDRIRTTEEQSTTPDSSSSSDHSVAEIIGTLVGLVIVAFVFYYAYRLWVFIDKLAKVLVALLNAWIDERIERIGN
ncbi:hypothetical protein HK104_005156 [Borealophlyctis nickersoniae]|nr:hypothetical protein HK104_005156 [Borealophlyctis nickersoniae]